MLNLRLAMPSSVVAIGCKKGSEQFSCNTLGQRICGPEVLQENCSDPFWLEIRRLRLQFAGEIRIQRRSGGRKRRTGAGGEKVARILRARDAAAAHYLERQLVLGDQRERLLDRAEREPGSYDQRI